MKTKSRYTALALTIIGILLVAYISTFEFFRLDLTSEGRYTLSDFTKEMLEKNEESIYIKVYLEGEELSSGFKKMKGAITEIIDEFNIYASFPINYEFINPTVSKDKKVRFALYEELLKSGLTPIETSEHSDEGTTSKKMVFPGLIMTYKGASTGVNLLKNDPHFAPESEQNINNSIQSLEYELMNAIQKLSKKKKPQIAFIEGHGELSEYQVMDMSRILSEYYDVQRGRINGQPGILDPFKAIVIARPMKKFTEQDKFVLDQYIMKGGKVLWLMETTNVNLDSLFINSETLALAHTVNLEDQLFKYGVRINPNLLLDKQSSPIAVSVRGSDGQPTLKKFPWMYFPVIATDNTHPVSKYLNYIKTEFIGTLDTVGENPKVKKTILLKSTVNTKVEAVPVKIELASLSRKPNEAEFKSGKKNIAVLLEGKFPSLFTNRPVYKYFPAKPDIKAIEESAETKMIVIGDGDIIKNEVGEGGKPYPVGFDRFSKQVFNGNKELILNAVNYLCDDGGLMEIRSRELKMRLLDVDKIKEQRTSIQITNVLIPILIVVFIGLIIAFVRKYKYGK